MGNSKRNLGIILAITCQIVLSFGVPPEENKTPDNTGPFGKCHTYALGGKRGEAETEKVSIKGSSKLAFYPITNEDTKLYFHIDFPDGVFKVNVDGTMFTLEQCDLQLANCHMIDEGGVKIPDYIKSRQWNTVEVRIIQQYLTISIGQRMLKSMSVVDYKNMDEATWSVLVNKENIPTKTSKPQEEYLYLVQFNCNVDTKENYETTPVRQPVIANPSHHLTTIHKYVTTSNSVYGTTKPAAHHITTAKNNYPNAQPHLYETTPYYGHKEVKGFGYEGLIIGLIVAALLIIVIAVVVYYVVKKKKSANITEQSPLQTQAHKK